MQFQDTGHALPFATNFELAFADEEDEQPMLLVKMPCGCLLYTPPREDESYECPMHSPPSRP